jgi:hypothetical protein
MKFYSYHDSLVAEEADGAGCGLDWIDRALGRSDFTINALALAVAGRNAHQIIDPYGGLRDLDEATMRTPTEPHEVLGKYPIRSLRAITLAALRSMELEPSLAEAIRWNKAELARCSQQARTGELWQLLIAGGPAVARAAAMTEQLGITFYLFGELAVDVATREQLAQLGDHSMAVRALTLMATRLGRDCRDTLVALQLPRIEVALVVESVQIHDQLVLGLDRAQARQLVRKHSDGPILSAINAAAGSQGAKMLDSVWERESTSCRSPLPASGRDFVRLGLEGQSIGDALRAVETAVSYDPEIELEAAIQAGFKGALEAHRTRALPSVDRRPLRARSGPKRSSDEMMRDRNRLELVGSELGVVLKPPSPEIPAAPASSVGGE